jgi:hypothetical protein
MTRADRGDWDMHPSDAEPEPEPFVVHPDEARYDLPEPAACATERRRRSLDEEEADEAGDAWEADYWKRGE